METLKSLLPAWASALIVMLLSATLAGVVAWQAGGDAGQVTIAVLCSVLGVGVAGAKALPAQAAAKPADATAQPTDGGSVAP